MKTSYVQTVLRTDGTIKQKVGSGKISRRIKLIAINKIRRRTKQPFTQIKSQPKDKKLHFRNSLIKIIFQNWQSKGFPFVRHQETPSKVTHRIINLLKPICKKYESRQIIQAINDGHKLFHNKSFVFFHAFSQRKIEFDTFLRYDAGVRSMHRKFFGVKNNIKKHGIDLPTSWFQECLKGWDYLKKTYFISAPELKDDYPHLTEQALRMMNEHRNREINEKGKRDLIRFSRMLANWGRLNDFDPMWLIDRIEEALNSFRTIKINKTYYLTTEIFWSETLPDELVRYNKLHYEGRDFVYDKEEMLK